MEKIFIVAVIITLIYCAIRFVEMKFIDKQMKPLKVVVRDTLIVGICSIIGSFIFFQLELPIYNFFNVVTDSKVVTPINTQVFTDDPGF